MIKKIYFYTGTDDAIKAYEIFEETKHLIDDEQILPAIKNKYLYMEGFTMMLLGDLEFAQKV